MVNPNLPNFLTILRIIMSFFVVYFLLQNSLSSRIIALIFFSLASLTDFFDGYIARKYNLITKFGKIADPTADKILTIASFITFAILNLFSFIWLIPIIIRELWVTIYRIKDYINDTNDHVAAKMSGKIKTVTQIITIIVMFFTLILRDHYNYIILENLMIIIMYCLLLLTVILTIYSGFSFLIKKGAK